MKRFSVIAAIALCGVLSVHAQSAEEVMRTLAPLGVACVKQDGEWHKTIKPWPEEIDEWTHFLHGADNNAVARDTVVGPPKRYQWISGPRWARSHDHLSSLSAMVSTKGRIFYIIDEAPVASVASSPNGGWSPWATVSTRRSAMESRLPFSTPRPASGCGA